MLEETAVWKLLASVVAFDPVFNSNSSSTATAVWKLVAELLLKASVVRSAELRQLVH